MDFQISAPGESNDPLAKINSELAKMRRDNDEINKQAKSLKSGLSEFNKEEQAIRDAFMAKLKEVQDKKFSLQAEITNLESNLSKNLGSIEALSKEAAELLSKRDALEVLAKLEATIRQICENFDAWDKARPFQHDDILFIINAYQSGLNGILNANDMGLGKTFETAVSDFVLCELFRREFGREPNVLWLTKKSLVKSNLKEILTWNPTRKCIPLMGGDPVQREMAFQLSMLGNAMLMCNYEVVRTTPMIAEADWDFIYIDEVHKLKGGANQNGPTAIWSAVKDLCRKARFMIFLSGTPMVNRPQEMWSYLHIFAPEKFPTVRKFEYQYGTPVWDDKKMQIVQVIDPELVIKTLAGQTIRRRRDEVKIQLPDLTREFVYIDMTDAQREAYNKMRDHFFVWLDQQAEEKKSLAATAIIAQLTRLRQINTWPDSIIYTDPITQKEHHLTVGESAKLDEAFDKCEQLIEAGEQVVVYTAQFNGPIEELSRRLISAGYSTRCLTGKTSSDADILEDDFQQKRCDVLLINMATGSEGMNLQKNPERWPGGASYAIFLDLWWSPAKNEQAEARIHRQGATDPCTIYILQSNDSVDAFIAMRLEEKSGIFAKIMESDAIRPATDWRDFLEGNI